MDRRVGQTLRNAVRMYKRKDGSWTVERYDENGVVTHSETWQHEENAWKTANYWLKKFGGNQIEEKGSAT